MGAVLAIAGALFLVVYGGLMAICQVTTERACLRSGYPGAKVSFVLERYCVKRVDQTDVVVPLSVVRKR
jgi:hypothetical protein